jgi:glycosyltransferase involved in cell wall biosynthesis
MTRDLIVFGEDWGGLPSSTQHLIRRLAKTRKVVWVNSIGLRRPKWQWRDIKRALRKLRHCSLAMAAPPSADNDQLHIVHPRTLPAPRGIIARQLARMLLKRQLAPILAEAQLQQPILWTSLPTAVDMAGELGESALVYYCGDDFGALAGVDHDVVTQRERELISKADLILAASTPLARRFPQQRTRLLPHGVDYQHFSNPAPRASDLPNDGRPIAGFYGSLSEWVNIELIATTAKRLPDWHFVLIGEAVVDISPLKSLSNVILLGPRPHQQLPSYSQHWTVSLLPFHDNAQIQACNPLKLLEYLAVGRPIVSTPFPALAAYSSEVNIVLDAMQMSDTLQQLGDSSVDQAQQQLAARHDWNERAQQLAQWLDAL